MKNIIIIALLLPVFCFGQKKVFPNPDSMQYYQKEMLDTNRFYIMENGKKVQLTAEYTPPTIRQDTIKTILLVSDTSHGSYTAMTSRVWWMKGWMIYEPLTIQLTSFDQVPEPIYLDSEKQPLRKGLVVFLTKEIK